MSHTQQDDQGHIGHPGAQELARRCSRSFWEPQEAEPRLHPDPRFQPLGRERPGWRSRLVCPLGQQPLDPDVVWVAPVAFPAQKEMEVLY